MADPTAESATYCTPCDATVAVVAVQRAATRVLFEYEADGFTVSPHRHVCCPRDERAAQLIERRRAALAADTAREDQP